ncbi:MAG: MCE family protein [Phycisphaerales bacterium]|nr:MCE family protein [Phycisphaerales bacterium]
MDRIRRDTLLGFVFFGSLAFLLWATLNLTDQAYGNAKLLVRLAQAGSCEVGTNVMVLGKKIGKVGAIDVDYDSADLPIAMTLLLREPIPLRQDYAISIKDAGVLGGKQVYIDPGRAAALPADAALRGEVEPGAFDQIGNIAKGEGKLGGKAVDAVEEIRKFFANMNDPTTSVGKLVTSSALHDQLSDAADSLGRILDAVLEQKGAVGDLVMNAETKENLHGFLASLRSLGKKLDAGTDGVLGVLLNDPDAARNVQSIVRNLDVLVTDARNGGGIVGKLLRDDELARRFSNLVGNLDTLLANLTNAEAGALGALTSDPATARDIKTTLANLRFVSEQLAQKQGLLGAMINDPDLATRFRRILTQVSRAIEDAREAAPIGSFIQVLIGYW